MLSLKKLRGVKQEKNAKKLKIKGYSEKIANYIDLFKDKNINIDKLEIALNESGQIDIKIVGSEKKE